MESTVGTTSLATTESGELKRLKEFIQSIGENPVESGPDSDTIRQWREGALASISQSMMESEEDEPEAANGYTTFNIEASSGTRTYRAEISLDNDFNQSAKDQIKRAAQIMITRMVAGQLNNFIRYAKPEASGLRSRRDRNLKFPITLPYLNPRPTTIAAQIAEEGGIVEAAVFKAFSSSSPTQRVKAKVLKYRKLNSTSMGFASVNHYYSYGTLRINLNEAKLDDNGVTDDMWAGIMAHEFLHNLGWEHPDGIYTLALPIEIYQACISGGHHLDESSIR